MNSLLDYLTAEAEKKGMEPVPLPDEKEMENPVITGREYGNKRSLFPFPRESLCGYRMPKTGQTDLSIVCGVATRLEGNTVTVTSGKTETTFSVTGKDLEKIRGSVPGIKVTAAVSGGTCAGLKLGPYFGAVSWKLFSGKNKKSATEFIIR